MRFSLLVSALVALCLSTPATAQVKVFGGSSDRHSTFQILFGGGPATGIAIEHGQPVWQDKYDGMLDQLKGKTLRLGANWWTTMTTGAQLQFGKTKIPAGSYLLGLHCDDKGEFSLTFLEATKGMKAGALPFGDKDGKMNWKPDFTAKLRLRKNATEKPRQKLKITLKVDAAKPEGKNNVFSLSWGKHKLITRFMVKRSPAPAGDKK